MKKSDFDAAMQTLNDAETYAEVKEIYKYLSELEGFRKPSNDQLDELFWTKVYRNPELKGVPPKYKQCRS